MASAKNTKLVSYIDCAGGGQVWVDGQRLYIGHMQAPSGTTIVDISDPRHPRTLARIDVPDGWHSHKVRVANGIMIVNHEAVGKGGPPDHRGGLAIYDVSRPDQPKMITKWETAGAGVHRYDFDGRYAYVSATVEGYVGNIVVILDLADPARPTEVSRWWIPGQWKAGGEDYPWADFVEPRCHHPLRAGNRLNVSYWHHGMYILDISDLTRPKMISGHRRSPAFPHPTHTCLSVPTPLKGRKVMVVADEDVAALRPSAPAFAWVFDVTDETLPTPIATINVEGLDKDGSRQPPMTGCHQPSERFSGTIIPFAWFAQGLRLFDIHDPFSPREVGHYMPDPPAGADRASSNDVTMDERGLIYLVDRIRGVSVIETKLND
ncbi:MAG TPA: hypothetical protein VNR11_07305 [Xanthobacteraceae bacterium]|nr:hypothetical protein [Xanthobacteraceae bacterium]